MRVLFEGGPYMRKYGIYVANLRVQVASTQLSLILTLHKHTQRSEMSLTTLSITFLFLKSYMFEGTLVIDYMSFFSFNVFIIACYRLK